MFLRISMVLLALAYYMQVRHMYQLSGLWDPDLGELPRPPFAQAEHIPLNVPVQGPFFSIL